MCLRVKNDLEFIFTTRNIGSFKSTIKFLFFFQSMRNLDKHNPRGYKMDHIANALDNDTRTLGRQGGCARGRRGGLGIPFTNAR